MSSRLAITQIEDRLVESPVQFLPLRDRGEEWLPVNEWTDRDWRQWLKQHNRYDFLKPWTESEIDQYLNRDRHTFSLRFKRQKSENWDYFYTPLPIAIPFHSSKVPNILFGGAAGGSKSHSARFDAYRHCFAIPNYRAIIMRRTFPQLERNHLKDVRKEVEKINAYFGREVMEYLPSKPLIRFPVHGVGNDSEIVFGHCQNPGDEEQYLGDAYDSFYPDEMATFTQEQIVGIGGRLRTATRGIIPRMAGTSNPGGAHTLWLKQYFIDKDQDAIRQVNPKYRADRYTFLPAMLYDNPYYMDPDGTYTNYEERLFSYGPERRRQLLLGDWDALTGQFFPEFSDKTHVKVLPIPPNCKIERWVDWGYDPDYGMCLWVACLPDGRLYVIYEWKFNGQHARQKYVAADVAKRIKQITFEEVLPLVQARRITKTVADPAMWNRSDGHTGEDYAETFARCGVPMIKGDNERVMGWGRFRHWLNPAPDGLPWLMFHPRCATSIRTIPTLVRDENDPDDVETTGEDHPADACFPAGTLVLTSSGERPIESLTVGTLVWTRGGLRNVEAVFTVGERNVWEVTAGSCTVKATPDHKFWVEGRGFVPLSHIGYGDMMRTCTLTNSDDQPAVSGGIHMVPSRQNTISTTLMGIRRIITSRICNVFPRLNISRSTGSRTRAWPLRVGAVAALCSEIRNRLFAGMPARPNGGGISGWTMSGGAVPVESFFGVPDLTTPPIVQGNVGGPDTTFENIERLPVRAGALSPLKAPWLDGVRVRVESVRPAGKAVVYNITVADKHEYFAGRLLVANCRYGLMSRPTPTELVSPLRVLLAGSPAALLEENRSFPRKMGQIS